MTFTPGKYYQIDYNNKHMKDMEFLKWTTIVQFECIDEEENELVFKELHIEHPSSSRVGTYSIGLGFTEWQQFKVKEIDYEDVVVYLL